MGRPLRIIVPNLPFHIINRGNARQAVFRDKEDFEYYLQLSENGENGVKSILLKKGLW